MTKTHLLFLIILIEGYVVLAVELLAIRQLLPFVGSGVEVVAIVISGVLLPLALGYHYGGTVYRSSFARAKLQGYRSPSIRRILLRNLLIALFILAFGLSYIFLELFFIFLTGLGIRHRLLQTGIYTLVFLVMPVFCLGQTVPLISHYFSRRRLSEITGKMLFFSTAGAFLGSVFSTLVLMMTVGVHNTVIATLTLLTSICILLTRKKRRRAAYLGLFFLFIAINLNCGYYLRVVGIVSDNAYNMARIVHAPNEDVTYLMLNRAVASAIGSDIEKRDNYYNYINTNFIATLQREGTPRDVLIIGAGGFVIGLKDSFNRYTYVDIDPDLKKVAETSFLPEKLTPNKQFIVSSARTFVRHDDKKYDLVVLDVFQNVYAIPMECTTREFLQDVKARLKDHGMLAVNVITSPDFRDKFSARYDRTFSDVFPIHSRQIIGDYNPWRIEDSSDPSGVVRNTIYTYANTFITQDDTIYTDDKNTYSIDKP